MNDEERGLENEQRFFAVVGVKTAKTPDWFLKVSGVSPSMDIRGIDAMASIRDRNGGTPIKVPVQIKSSYAGLCKYYDKYPGHLDAGVIVIVVHCHRTDDDIRSALYRELKTAYERGSRFDDFLARLMSSRLSVHAFRLMRKGVVGTRRRIARNDSKSLG